MRIYDLGGWTDTWFARHGVVCNISISPGAEVRVVTHETAAPRVVLDVEQFGDRYAIDPTGTLPGWHPMLEAAVAAMPLPRDHDLEINVRCELPAGSAVGTSASTLVALLGRWTR